MMHVGKDIEAILEHCRMTPGVPVKPMLAQPCKEIAMIFKRFEDNRFTCEYKYDGLRGQVHYMDGDVQLFSRNLENMTEQYPDVVELIKQGVGEGVRNYIFDSEIVAFDPNTVYQPSLSSYLTAITIGTNFTFPDPRYSWKEERR